MRTENIHFIFTLAFGLASLIFILLGIRFFFAPEAKKENYVKTKAIVRSRMMDSEGSLMPTFEFEAEGEKVLSKPRFPVSSAFSAHIGDTVPILYCPGRILFFKTYSVVLDDNGHEQSRLIRFYHIAGPVSFLVGLVFILAVVLFHYKK